MSKKIISKNKKAFHDYEILERIEAGIILTGSEIKSIRNGNINLKGSYVSIKKGKPFLNESHISPYKFSGDEDYNPTRNRELLLKKKEVSKLETKLNEKGNTLIPLQVYLIKGLAKIELGLCRGKKQFDKRHDLKKKSQDKEIKRTLKNY